MTAPVGGVRTSPSGRGLSGNVGDVLVCLGGNNWHAAPAASSGAAPAPADPGDNGAVATASGGFLRYLKGTVTAQSLTWSGAAWVAALLVNANISGSAAIDLSKLGQNGASSGQAIVWNGSAWAPAAVSSPVNLPVSPGDNGKAALASAGNLIYGAIDPTVLTVFAASTGTGQYLQGNGPGVAASWVTAITAPANSADDGKMPRASAGNFVYFGGTANDVMLFSGSQWGPGTIANANVGVGAAINCTKTDGNFGAVNVVTTGFVTIGATPATTGTAFRLGNGLTALVRNSTNTVDAQWATWTGNPVTFQLGESTNIGTIFYFASTLHGWRIGATTRFQVLSTGTVCNGTMLFDVATSTPSLTQNSTTAAGNTMRVIAQASSLAAGADLILAPGTGNVSGVNGTGRLQDAALVNMLTWKNSALGLYTATPVAQQTRPGQLTDSTTGTPSTTLVDVGVAFSQANVNNNFASVLTKLNAIESKLSQAAGGLGAWT